MRRLALLLALVAFGCGGGGGSAGDADEPTGTAGGETATEPATSEPSCADLRCGAGEHCEVVEVQCIRAPCPPLPQCVPDPTACAAVRCMSGTRCVEEAGTARCVPEEGGVPCGSAVCAAGQVCCNASCGICTEPGGVCIQQACTP